MVGVAGGFGGESGYVKGVIAAGFGEGDVDLADRQCVSEEGSARAAPVLPRGGLLVATGEQAPSRGGQGVDVAGGTGW